MVQSNHETIFDRDCSQRPRYLASFSHNSRCSPKAIRRQRALAASTNAPLVFFCQNNQWAISSAVETQTKVPLYRRGEGFGVPGIRVDGNDVLACYAVTKKHMDDARNGLGPYLIEALTYRIGAHTTSDDPSKYRDPEQVAYWQARDPIIRFEKFLRSQGIGQDFFDEVQAAGDQLAAEIRDQSWVFGR